MSQDVLDNSTTAVPPPPLTTVMSPDGDVPDAKEDEVSTAVYFTVAIILTFTCLVGIFFNGMAIVVFAKNKQLRTPTNSFVMALCVCDLVMCLVGMPIPASYSWRQTHIKSQAICVFHSFTIFFFSLSSLNILAAISVDRYIVIVRPLTSSMVTQRMASLAIAVCFLVGFFWTLMPMLGWNRYMLEGIGVACSVNWQPGENATDSSYVFFVFAFCFLLPLITMSFCYANIYKAIRNIARSSPWGANSHIAQNNYRLEKKMLKTIIIMVASYLVSWTPYTAMGLVETVTGNRVVGPVVETFPALFAKTSAVWDPIIYIATNLQFRRAFFELCPCCEICLAVCISGDASVDGSQTVLDPESRAVMENAEMERQAKAQVKSDTPKGGPHHLAVNPDSITLETKISPEPSSNRVGAEGSSGGGIGKGMKVMDDGLPPVD